MNRDIEIKVFDSCNNLPDSVWSEMTRELEKEFAVKWYVIFAYSRDEIVGFMRILRNPDNVCQWYIGDVYVCEEARRRGIAKQMYDEAIELINQYHQAADIITSVSAKNKASIALHKKLGFYDSEIKSKFLDFQFEDDETIYHYWLSKYYPAKNVPIHIEMLFPMWKKYMIEIGEEETDDDLLNGLVARINIANSNENVYFDMIWSGNIAIGFAFYSVDGGIKGVIPPGYGYIMELYIEDSWRRRCIGTGGVKHVCERLNKAGCEKVYLTSIPKSECFWTNSVFVKTDLLDPDNLLNILIRNI